MGANAQTAVPAFTAGQVLTAAQQTQINTGIPVFASTVERDAAFGGSGEKVLAQGQYAYIEATSTLQVYTGSVWVSAITSGLNLITAQTIGSAVGSVTVTGAFSSTYDNYKIIVSGGVASAANDAFSIVLGASATGYNYQYINGAYANSPTANGASNAVRMEYAGAQNTNYLSAQIEMQGPFLASPTTMQAQIARTASAGTMTGIHTVASSFTAFTLAPPSGTFTGGTIYVYGYAKA
jgi:hypothetical protein